MKGGSNRPKVSDELSVNINKPKETLNLLMSSGNGPINNNTNLFWVHLDLPFRHDESQEGHGEHVKLTFISFNKELVMEEALEDPLDMLDKSLLIRRED